MNCGKALKKAQLENGQLKEDIKTLQAKVATYDGIVSKREVNKAAKEGDGLPPDVENQIKALGREFVVVGEIWVDEGVGLSPFRKPRPNFAYNSPLRYRNTENERLGILDELYCHVPDALHELLQKHSRFEKVVCCHFVFIDHRTYLLRHSSETQHSRCDRTS